MSQHLHTVIKLIEQSQTLNDTERKSALLELKNALLESNAYAREARLEVSLEKVRKKTMTMRNTSDVAETVALMFDEMMALGVKTIRCGIGIMKSDMEMEIWTSNAEAKDKAELIVGVFDMTMHAMFRQARASWENKEKHFMYDLLGDDLIAYYTAVNSMRDYKTKYDLVTVPKHLFHNSFHFNEGTLFVFSLEQLPDEICEICKRFAGVFGQTYRRFLDLQEAEMQKHIVEEKHKETLDSINYARRIQLALLPSEAYLKRTLRKE
jgi:hypothetical protein